MNKPILTKERLKDFLSKIDFTDDCWIWTGSTTVNSGGRPYPNYSFRYNKEKKNFIPYRVMHSWFVNPIGSRKMVHHKCQQPLCVNPTHLTAVTQKEHSALHTCYNAKKTHCLRGHKFSKENTYRNSGSRFCRSCRQEQSRKRYLASK